MLPEFSHFGWCDKPFLVPPLGQVHVLFGACSLFLVEVAASSGLRWAQAIISCCTLLSKDPAAFSSRPSHTMEFEGILFVVAVLALLAVPWQDWGQVIWTSLKIKHVQKIVVLRAWILMIPFPDS